MPKKPREPLKPLRVSLRDREIYEQVVVQQLTQRQVAAAHKLSQPRVCNIVHRVARWLSETAPAGLAEIPRPQRLYLAARTYQMKLQHYERQAQRAFDQTQEEQFVSTYDLVQGPDGKFVPSGKGKMQRKNAKPDVKLLNAAQKYAYAQVEFEGFDQRGEVKTTNEGRLYEEPLRGREEEKDELARRMLIWAKQRQLESGSGREGDKERGREDRRASRRQPDVSEPAAKACDCDKVRETYSVSGNDDIKPLSGNNAHKTQSGSVQQVAVETPLEVGLSQKQGEMAEVMSGIEDAAAKNVAAALSTSAANESGVNSQFRPLTPALSPEYRGEGETPRWREAERETVKTREANPSLPHTLSPSLPPESTKSKTQERNPPPREIGDPLPGPAVFDARFQKWFPPAPYGYHRSGDRCWLIPYQKIGDPIPRGQPRPPQPANCLALDEWTQQWVAV